MSRIRILFISVLAFTLSSCAANVQHQTGTNQKLNVSSAATKKLVMVVEGSKVATESKDWEMFRAEWRTAMKTVSTNAGISFEYQESINQEIPPDAATLVVLTVNDYRYITPGARYGFGVFTGNAYIDANATFLEIPGKKPVGTRKYDTSSTAWQGVFSAMTDKQIFSICEEIVKEIR